MKIVYSPKDQKEEEVFEFYVRNVAHALLFINNALPQN